MGWGVGPVGGGGAGLKLETRPLGPRREPSVESRHGNRAPARPGVPSGAWGAPKRPRSVPTLAHALRSAPPAMPASRRDADCSPSPYSSPRWRAAPARPRPSAPWTPRRPPSPTVVLVSIDGFRWDYLDRPGVEAPTLSWVGGGVRAERLVPVFPTKTFPNHYSLVTGLHPEDPRGRRQLDARPGAAGGRPSRPGSPWGTGRPSSTGGGGWANRCGSRPSARASGRGPCSGPAPRPRSPASAPAAGSGTTARCRMRPASTRRWRGWRRPTRRAW